MTQECENMSMKYIREHYNVPAKRGMEVIAQGRKGTIVGSSNTYLRIRIEGEEMVGLYHPTWKMEYMVEE